MKRPPVLAVRHAPTDAAGRCIGQTDVPTVLSADAAAERVLEALAGSRTEIARVWSSDLQRCAAPAAIVATARGVPHRVEPGLRELAYGEWDGRAWDEIERSDSDRMARWMADWEREKPPGGETVAELEARVRRWEAGLSPNEAVLLLAHAGVVRALRVLRSGTSWGAAMREPVGHLELVAFGSP